MEGAAGESPAEELRGPGDTPSPSPQRAGRGLTLRAAVPARPRLRCLPPNPGNGGLGVHSRSGDGKGEGKSLGVRAARPEAGGRGGARARAQATARREKAARAPGPLPGRDSPGGEGAAPPRHRGEQHRGAGCRHDGQVLPAARAGERAGGGAAEVPAGRPAGSPRGGGSRREHGWGERAVPTLGSRRAPADCVTPRRGGAQPLPGSGGDPAAARPPSRLSLVQPSSGKRPVFTSGAAALPPRHRRGVFALRSGGAEGDCFGPAGTS